MSGIANIIFREPLSTKYPNFLIICGMDVYMRPAIAKHNGAWIVPYTQGKAWMIKTNVAHMLSLRQGIMLRRRKVYAVMCKADDCIQYVQNTISKKDKLLRKGKNTPNIKCNNIINSCDLYEVKLAQVHKENESIQGKDESGEGKTKYPLTSSPSALPSLLSRAESLEKIHVSLEGGINNAINMKSILIFGFVIVAIAGAVAFMYGGDQSNNPLNGILGAF